MSDKDKEKQKDDKRYKDSLSKEIKEVIKNSWGPKGEWLGDKNSGKSSD